MLSTRGTEQPYLKATCGTGQSAFFSRLNQLGAVVADTVDP